MDDLAWGGSKLPAFAEHKEAVNNEGGREGEGGDEKSFDARCDEEHSEIPFSCEEWWRGRRETGYESNRFS